MKQLAVWVLAAGLMCTASSEIKGNSTEWNLDSLCQWLAEDEVASWMRVVEATRKGEQDVPALPEPAYIGLLPNHARPQWAQVPDSVYWRWMQAGLLAFEVSRGSMEATLEADASVHAWASKESAGWRYAAFALWSTAAACFVLMLVLVALRRRSLAFDAGDWQALADGIAHLTSNPAVREDWKAFKARGQMEITQQGRWALLNASEREVAMFLSQHFPVNAIAKKLACSPSYIYNLRSSIRKKWEIGPDEDLVQVIGYEIEAQEGSALD